MIVQFLETLLHLKVCIESQQFLPELANHVLLLAEHLVEGVNVLLDIAARLVHIRYQTHLVLLDIDDLVDVLLVALDQVLLLTQDHPDQLVVVLVHLLQVSPVVVFHFGVIRHRWQVLNALE